MSSNTRVSCGFQISLGLILAGAIFWFYWPILVSLTKALLANEDYSFGLLLPFVSAYIIYLKWPQIRRGPWQPSWMGLAIIALGLFLLLIGELALDLFVPRLSFVVVSAGLLYLFGGRKILTYFLFPLLLIIMMIPLPGFIIKQLTIPLQLASSKLAAWFLQSAGFPLVRHGNVIDLGVRQLQVVEACSGLRYILALLSLGAIFVYFYQRRFWKAALLIILVVPAAVLANALRVAAMGVFPSLQQGFLHTFSGWLIFIFCFAVLGLVNWYFLTPPQPLPSDQEATLDPEELPIESKRISFTSYLLAALLLVIPTGLLMHAIPEITPLPPRQPLSGFPMEIGSWHGHQLPVGREVFEVLKSDDYLNAEFFDQVQGTVSLWIDYYKSQQTSLGIHSPFACLQGAGGTILDARKINIAPGLPVNALVMDNAGRKMLVYYWFLQRGRWMTSEYWGKFLMGYDRFFRRRADGCLIRLITPVNQDVESARERLSSFARLLIPILPQYIEADLRK